MPQSHDQGKTQPSLDLAVADSDRTSQYQLLLVEDEPGVRAVVTQMLGSLGYKLLVAESAQHALELIAQEQVDLLISDVIMPDMRGPELYRQALERKPDLSALFISGYSEEVFSSLPSEENRIGYLGKPFTVRQLQDAVNELIEE